MMRDSDILLFIITKDYALAEINRFKYLGEYFAFLFK